MKEYSKTAYGRRTQFKNITCEESKCIYKAEEISLSCGQLPFKAWFETQPQTWYFLSVTGRVVPPEWTDIQFGICDGVGYPLPNPHQKHEKAFYVYNWGLDQELSIKGQDGGEYTRIYGFYSGSNEKMAFFAEGNEGRIILSDVRVFAYADAVPIAVKTEAFPLNWVEDANTCDEESNLITDTAPWASSFSGFGDFIDFADNMLCFDSKGCGAYYLAWLPIEKAGVYTFTFSSRVLEAGDSRFGVVCQDIHGKRKFIMEKNNSSVSDWNKYADMYAVPDGVKVGFAVFNGGGKINFKDFKLFFSADAKTVKEDDE